MADTNNNEDVLGQAGCWYEGVSNSERAKVRGRRQEDKKRASAGGRWHENVGRRATARARRQEGVG